LASVVSWVAPMESFTAMRGGAYRARSRPEAATAHDARSSRAGADRVVL